MPEVLPSTLVVVIVATQDLHRRLRLVLIKQKLQEAAAVQKSLSLGHEALAIRSGVVLKMAQGENRNRKGKSYRWRNTAQAVKDITCDPFCQHSGIMLRKPQILVYQRCIQSNECSNSLVV